MNIEIDLFSGRPNPQWTATDAESLRVRATLDALSPSTATRPRAPALGYRGFRVTEPGRLVEVYGTAVTVTERDGRTVVLDDPDRRTERDLLTFARDHVEPGLLDHVRSPDS